MAVSIGEGARCSVQAKEKKAKHRARSALLPTPALGCPAETADRRRLLQSRLAGRVKGDSPMLNMLYTLRARTAGDRCWPMFDMQELTIRG